MDKHKKATLFNVGLLLLVCVGGIIIAYILNNNPAWLKRWTHSNFGTLVKPQVEIKTNGLVKLDPKKENSDISKLPPESLKRYWTYVTLSPSNCDNVCLRNLHYQLRVRLTQGQHIYQVRVLYIVTDTKELKTLLAKAGKFPDLHFALVTPAVKTSFLAQFKLKATDNPITQQRIYLLDPPGNLMMYYKPYKGDARDFTLPTGMKKDLAKLIKTNRYSYPKTKKGDQK